MKRTNMKMGIIVLALGASWAHAGYESIPAPKAAQMQSAVERGAISGIVDRNTWVGGVVQADGTETALENAGGYFLPIDLEQGVKCQIWVSGAGLVPGRPVTLLCLHGGLINGKEQDTIMVGKDSRIRFEYANGTFGAQPIQATIFGNTATLLSVKAIKAVDRVSEERGSNEAQ